MSKNRIIIVGVVVVVAVFLGFLQYRSSKANVYSVVYLTTGEVYIGHLTTFPDMQLKDSYILQITKDPTDSTKSNFQLNPIDQALWAPSTLHLEAKNVVFYGPLLPDSKIAQAIAAKK